MKDEAPATDDRPTEPGRPKTIEGLRAARQQAGARVLLNLLQNPEMKDSDYQLVVLSIERGLTDDERQRLVLALLSTFAPDVGEEMVKDAFLGSGWPAPSLYPDSRSDAKFWAAGANSNEIESYAVACVERMSPKRRSDFARWVQSKT